MRSFLLLSAIPGAYSAGMTAHNVIAHRAAAFERFNSSPEKLAAFSGLSLDRVDALQGGAPFPDYLYACGDDHNAGEMAHWEPFQQHAASYIRETYPDWAADRTGDGAGLVAFFNGVVSHYIADENWHGLCEGCTNKGLIKQIGYSDFTCTGDLCSNAHTATDTGGEFVAASQLDLSWYPSTNWFVPTNDLVNIFQAMNTTCDWGSYCPTTKPLFIRECSLAFYAGSWAISHLGALIYPFMDHTFGSYLSGDGLIDSAIGGLDDDAAWTSFMQSRWADWVLDGPSEEDELRAMLQRRVEDPEVPAKRNWIQAIKKLLKEEEGSGVFYARDVGENGAHSIGTETLTAAHNSFLKKLSSVTVRQLINYDGGVDDGRRLLTDDRVDELEKTLYEEIDRLTTAALDSGDAQSVRSEQEDTPLYKGTSSHSRFGASISTSTCNTLVGSPGFSTLSHPQTGKATLFTCDGKVLDIPAPEEGYNRFGSTLNLADLNDDGALDAVICSTSYNAENVERLAGTYNGKCYVYLDVVGNAKPAGSIIGEDYGLFGSTIYIASNKDVYIAAPQSGGNNVLDNAGKVYKFSNLEALGEDVTAEEYADSIWVGEHMSHHGSSVAYHGDTTIIGSEVYHVNFNTDGKYAVGRVQGFVDGKEAWSITGCDHGSWLGRTVAVSESGVMAVSEIGYNATGTVGVTQLRAGRVTLIPLNVVTGDSTICELQGKEGVTVFEGRDAYGVLERNVKLFNEARFGDEMMWVGEKLVVAAPGFERGKGAVFLWNEGEVSAREGGLGRGSLFGRTFDVAEGGGEGKVGLVVSAPRMGEGGGVEGEEFGGIVKVNL
jgi:hypothetical protein